MTDKELRAYAEKLLRNANLPRCPYLRRRFMDPDVQSLFTDALYRRLIELRAKAQAERHLCYLGRHLGGSSAANPLDHD